MGALVATTPTRTGVVTTAGAAVSSSDTIDRTILGSRGCILEILNGGASPDTVTISDAGLTDSGAAPAANSPSVTNATNKAFLIRPSQADPVTGQVTIAHSFTTSVTYKLWPLGV